MKDHHLGRDIADVFDNRRLRARLCVAVTATLDGMALQRRLAHAARLVSGHTSEARSMATGRGTGRPFSMWARLDLSMLGCQLTA